MNGVTQVLLNIEGGDPQAAEQLLPLVYEELRRLAASKLARERPGQTLQATALVHEAYMQLVSGGAARSWDSRRHFFAAAAESMRQILIQRVRRKRARKHGGAMQRWELADADLLVESPTLDILALSEAIELLATKDPVAADLVKLRVFAGLSTEEAGRALDLPRRTAYRQWTYAQAWLRARLAAAR